MKEEKSIHPKRVLYSLLLLNLFLGIIVFVMPNGEFLFGKDDALKLQFLSKNDLLHPDTSIVVDVDSVIADIITVDTSLMEIDTSGQEIFDIQANRMIQYPDSTRNALQTFFEALYKTAKEGDLIRIVHYGDS